jgi:hypothetical protein
MTEDTNEHLGSSDCSIAVDAFHMRRVRERLASSPAERQRAIAEFPLRVVNVAKDLARLCQMRDNGFALTRESEDAMRYMEDQIRQCYREMFGTELGQ